MTKRRTVYVCPQCLGPKPGARAARCYRCTFGHERGERSANYRIRSATNRQRRKSCPQCGREMSFVATQCRTCWRLAQEIARLERLPAQRQARQEWERDYESRNREAERLRYDGLTIREVPPVLVELMELDTELRTLLRVNT